MRKFIVIATISFLASCSTGPASGPPTMVKENNPSPDLSISDIFGETGKVVLTHHLGPFDVPAGSKARDMLSGPGGVLFSVDEPIWITSFEPSIEDSEGNPLPKELVHFIVLVNHGEQNAFCTTKQAGNPFAAATSSMEKIELPDGHGYPVLPSDSLEARVILKNTTYNDYRGVYVKFALTGEPTAETRLMTDVTPMLIDVNPCDHKPISIAPGQFVEKTKSVFAPEDGSIIKAYGLLQDYGVSISMTAKDENEPFWQGLAEIDENYKITGLPPFEDPAGVPVKRGEKIDLTVAYNNFSDNWYDEATGAAIAYLARSDGGTPSPSGGTNEVSTKAAVAIQTQLLK